MKRKINKWRKEMAVTYINETTIRRAQYTTMEKKKTGKPWVLEATFCTLTFSCLCVSYFTCQQWGGKLVGEHDGMKSTHTHDKTTTNIGEALRQRLA